MKIKAWEVFKGLGPMDLKKSSKFNGHEWIGSHPKVPKLAFCKNQGQFDLAFK